MSAGWLTMSDSVAAEPTLQSERGKFTAATTYPAVAQARKSREYGPPHCMNPGPNTISGSGPLAGLLVFAGDPASGYLICVSSVRDPRCSPVGPVCPGSVNVIQRWPTRNLPSVPTPPAAGSAVMECLDEPVADGPGRAGPVRPLAADVFAAACPP